MQTMIAVALAAGMNAFAQQAAPGYDLLLRGPGMCSMTRTTSMP
jgi:hypothetical protein